MKLDLEKWPLFGDNVSLCATAWCGICSVDQTGLTVTLMFLLPELRFKRTLSQKKINKIK